MLQGRAPKLADALWLVKHVDSQRNMWTHQRLHGSMVSLKGKICRKQCFFLLPSNMGFPVDFPWFYWRGISCGYGSVWFKIGIPWSHFESNLNWENDAKSHGIWEVHDFPAIWLGDVMAHQRRSRLIRSSGRCYVFFNPLQLGFRRVKKCIVGFHIQLLHLSFPAFEEFQASMLAVSTTLWQWTIHHLWHIDDFSH